MARRAYEDVQRAREARDAARQYAIVATKDAAKAAELLALTCNKLTPHEYAAARIAIADACQGAFPQTWEGGVDQFLCVHIEHNQLVFEGRYMDGYLHYGFHSWPAHDGVVFEGQFKRGYAWIGVMSFATSDAQAVQSLAGRLEMNKINQYELAHGIVTLANGTEIEKFEA